MKLRRLGVYKLFGDRQLLAEQSAIRFGRSCSSEAVPECTHTLILPFETPANIICETINPVPLLPMFFGGRRHDYDFRLLSNARNASLPLSVGDVTLEQDIVCFVQLLEWWICIALAERRFFLLTGESVTWSRFGNAGTKPTLSC